MRSYTVIGAGAVGLLYGTRLAVAGHPVRWLVRSGADAIRASGIEVRSEGRLLCIDPASVEVHTDGATVPPSDVVLVATKTTANHRLVELVEAVCAPGSTVAVFQNGLGAEQIVRAGVSAAGPIIGGLCFVCAHRVAPGRADHLDYGAVTLAPLDTGSGVGLGAAAAVAADLTAAGIDATTLPDLGAARWRKLVWNIPFNGLCTVLATTTDVLLGDPHTRSLVAEMMDEVISASVAVGHPVDPGFRDEMLAVTDAMQSYEPSMKLDHDAGRPLETDAIYGVATGAARRSGAPMIRAEAVAAMLRLLDRPHR